ncbi:hypothetical protein UlMin_028322 [Ulmus minor]
MNSMFMNFLLWNYVSMKISLLMNFLFMELCFMEICLRMTKQVFITSFKVSYQPSDLREVMFRPKGTHDGKYEMMAMFFFLCELRNNQIYLYNLHQNNSEQGHEEEHESGPEIEQPVPPRAPEHLVIQQEPLYERFRHRKPDEFEGSSDPLVAEEWLSSIQTILDFMHLNEREKVLCATYVLKKDARYWWETVKMHRNVQDMTWDEFIVEFNQKYYNRVAIRAQQNEMLEMFCPELAVVIDSGDNPPTTVAECVDRALRAEYRLAQAKEERNRIFEARKNQKGQTKQGYEMKPNSQAQRTNQYGNNNNKRKGNFGGQKNGKG